MNKTLKIVIISVVSCILLVSLAFFGYFMWAMLQLADIFVGDALEKDEIFEIVLDNKELILAEIEADSFEKTSNIKGIKEVHSYENYVEFYCGGSGIGSGTTYSGFYYVEDEQYLPENKVIDGYEMRNEGAGWCIFQVDGDNYYYFEKICDNFYYFYISL